MRGELTPDPAKRKQRKPSWGPRKTSGMWPELGLLSEPLHLAARVDLAGKAGRTGDSGTSYDCRRSPHCRGRLLPRPRCTHCSPQPAWFEINLVPSNSLCSWLQSLLWTQPYPWVASDKRQNQEQVTRRGAGQSGGGLSKGKLRVLSASTQQCSLWKCHFASRHTELGKISLFSVWISQAFLT